jgi:signal transduction histidine kinase
LRSEARDLFAAVGTAIRRYSTIWLVGCIGLAISLLGFGMLQRQLRAHKSGELEWVEHNRFRALENGIGRGLEAVRSLGDLVLLSPGLNMVDFQPMARSILDRTPGLKSLSWMPWDPVEVDPEWDAADSLTVSVAPSGLDAGSERIAHEAVERSLETGRTTVSRRFLVPTPTGESFGFAAVHPVHLERGSDGLLDVSTDPIGFAVGVFLLSDLAQAAIDPLEPRGVECLIRDESAQPENSFLEFYSSRLSTPAAWDEESWALRADRLSSEVFPVADREWSVTCAPTERFRSAVAFDQGPWVALTAGVFFSFLLTSYLIRSRQNHRHRLHMEQALQERARLASVGVLAAGVAHEINNPNNAIAFNASVLSRAWDDAAPILIDYYESNGDFSLAGLPFEEARTTLPELLQQVGMNSTRIERIVENLKHLSKRDRSELESDVDLGAVLQEAVGILRRQIQELTDSFELHIPETLPRIRGSSQQLEQVFINVILNALQSLPDRQCRVSVEVDAEGDSGVVSIRVHDEGEGISHEHLEALTEPFFSTRADSGGTGLGLSISQSIIDRHGGRIEFESERDQGTTVTITLPMPTDEEK